MLRPRRTANWPGQHVGLECHLSVVQLKLYFQVSLAGRPNLRSLWDCYLTCRISSSSVFMCNVAEYGVPFIRLLSQKKTHLHPYLHLVDLAFGGKLLGLTVAFQSPEPARGRMRCCSSPYHRMEICCSARLVGKFVSGSGAAHG